MVVLEGSWVGDRTGDAMEICGYSDLCERYGVEFWDTQKDGSYQEDCQGMKLNLCDSVRKIEFLINVPVWKGHCQTKITCALKNLKGLIPNSEKRRFHSMGLHAPIAHLNCGIHQDFIVVDHICGDLDFEDGGNPVVCDRILTARDRFCVTPTSVKRCTTVWRRCLISDWPRSWVWAAWICQSWFCVLARGWRKSCPMPEKLWSCETR